MRTWPISNPKLLELWLSGLTALSLLWALAAKAPATLRIYLGVQLGTFLGLVGVGLFYTRQSDPYRVAYGIATLAVTYASWRLVRAVGAEIVALLLSAMSACFACSVTMSTIQHWTPDNAILLVAGTLTMFFGTALTLRCRFSKYRSSLIPLAVLWVTLAVALFGFAVEAHRWDSLSYWLTYTLGLVVFGWIGWTGWRQRRMIRPRRIVYGDDGIRSDIRRQGPAGVLHESGRG
jgi:hypothetical protein